jgi:phosphoribosylformylglycinamidine synthase
VFLRTENNQTALTNELKAGEILNIPISHGEGNYFCDEQTLERLEKNKQIVFRYCSEKERQETNLTQMGRFLILPAL